MEVEARARLIEGDARLVAFLAAWWGACALAFAGALAAWLPQAALLVSPLAAMAGLALLVRIPRARTVECRVHAERGRLTFGERTLAADTVRQAAVVPDRDFAELRLTSVDGARTRLAFRSAKTAQRVLDALGLSPNTTTTRVTALETSLDGAERRLRMGLLTVGLAAAVFGRLTGDGRAAPWLVVGALVVAVVALVLTTFARPRLTFAEDGVEVRNLFGRTFVPLSAITDVYVGQDGRERPHLVLEADGFGVITLRMPAPEVHAEHLRALLSRRGRPLPMPTALARGDRSIVAWIEALRALGGKVTSFREDGVSLPDLRAIVEDPRAELSARAAAAVALAAHAEEHEALARIAEGSAAPRLRVAVEAATEDDEEALVEALADLDDAAR